ELYEPHTHAVSPHVSRGYADQQNSQPVSSESMVKPPPRTGDEGEGFYPIFRCRMSRTLEVHDPPKVWVPKGHGPFLAVEDLCGFLVPSRPGRHQVLRHECIATANHIGRVVHIVLSAHAGLPLVGGEPVGYEILPGARAVAGDEATEGTAVEAAWL